MCKVIGLLALVALATAAPVISLDLDESLLTEQTKHTGGYGVGCADNAKLCRKVAPESKYVHTCKAMKSASAKCPLPTAVGYDHHEGDLSDKVTYKTYLVNNNGHGTTSGAACADRNCIQYNRRSEWVTKFDLCDTSGNCADTAVFAIILNDIDPPVIEPAEVLPIEACSGSSSLPVAVAKDNCNSAGICSSNFNQPVSVTVTPASVGTTLSGKCSGKSGTASWTTKDNAGMFGNAGIDNPASKSFVYTIKDTIKPVCVTTRGELTAECKKNKYYNLKNKFGPTCTDACGMKSDLAVSIPNSYPRFPHATSATTFSFTQTDKNCNVGTITSKIIIVDTTPPVLKISNGGMHHMAQTVKGIRCKTDSEDTTWKDRTCTVHRKVNGVRNKIRCALADKTKCPKRNAMVAFSHAVARELGYQWNSESTIRLVLGNKKQEKHFVRELMQPGHGYTCNDACGGNKVEVSIHRNEGHPDTGMDCADLSTESKVEKFDHNYPGLTFLKYVCTDNAGLTSTKCRTLDNHKYADSVKAFIQVPSTVATKDLVDINKVFFDKAHWKHLGVGITAIPGEIILGDGRRRMLASCPVDSTCHRMDTFFFHTLQPGATFKALTDCTYEIHLADSLGLTCAPLEAEDPSFVCVKVEVEPPKAPGVPLIVVPDPVAMELEAYSNWDDPGLDSPQDPDLVEATKAYCIDPCDKEDILDCPGRLLLGKRTVIEIPASVCVDDKDPDIAYASESSFTVLDGVDMNKIGEYTIEYTCTKVIGTTVLDAIPKERVIKVMDTTKPSCATLTASITREAGFPYTPDVPVCKDTYWGNQGKQPATVTTGTFDVGNVDTYVLTYTATDHSGNVAPNVKQTIIVVDTLKPVIQLAFGAAKIHRSDALDTGVNGQKNPVHKPL